MFSSDASPQAALGADIIVGFPGETDEDFRATEEFPRANRLSTYFHVFSYSPRPGTAAASPAKPWTADDETSAGGSASEAVAEQESRLSANGSSDTDPDGVVIRDSGGRGRGPDPELSRCPRSPSARRQGGAVRYDRPGRNRACRPNGETSGRS